MNKNEQLEAFDLFVSQMKDTILLKGDDYAGEDRLSNFKHAGNITGIGAELNCLSLIATKVARLGQLLNGKEPNNESIEDSILDLANYSVLLYMITTENKHKISEHEQR